MFNVDFAQSAAFPVGDATAENKQSARPRPRRRTNLVLAGAAILAAQAVIVDPSRWTLLAALFTLALFICRRSIPRVLNLFAFGLVPYQLIWFTFVILRGLADQAPWLDRVRLWPRHFEAGVFGGELLNSRLQGWFFDPAQLHVYDYFFTFLHISYYLVPLVVAIAIFWIDPARGRRFLVSLALILAFGLPFFYLLPANPPWMDPATGDPNPVQVHRINAFVASKLGVDVFHPDGSLDGELNSVAVVPSMHMGVSLLLAVAVPRTRRRWRHFTAAYAGLMAFSLVYLGEHFITDEVVGIGLALVAWRVAPWIIAKTSLTLAPVTAPVQQQFANLIAAGRRKVASRRQSTRPIHDGSMS